MSNLSLIDALKAASEIMQAVKRSDDGQKRANIRLANRKLKKLKRELKKNGWEDWEKELYDDLVKTYAAQLKKLMQK